MRFSRIFCNKFKIWIDDQIKPCFYTGKIKVYELAVYNKPFFPFIRASETILSLIILHIILQCTLSFDACVFPHVPTFQTTKFWILYWLKSNSHTQDMEKRRSGVVNCLNSQLVDTIIGRIRYWSKKRNLVTFEFIEKNNI